MKIKLKLKENGYEVYNYEDKITDLYVSKNKKTYNAYHHKAGNFEYSTALIGSGKTINRVVKQIESYIRERTMVRRKDGTVFLR